MTIPIIYIAGPYTAPTAWDIAENVRDAERWGLRVARAGAMPLIPHANTSLFHGIGDDGFWYSGTIELMRRCDGVFVFATHHRHGKSGPSAGVSDEIAEARRLGLPLHILDESTGDGPHEDVMEQWIRETFGDRLHRVAVRSAIFPRPARHA